MTADEQLIEALSVVGIGLFVEQMRDKGICLSDDECVPAWTVFVAGAAMLGGDQPLWLVPADYAGDPLLAAAAVLAHPRYLRLKERSAREVDGCDRPDTCRHGYVRRSLLVVERVYFAALEDA